MIEIYNQYSLGYQKSHLKPISMICNIFINLYSIFLFLYIVKNKRHLTISKLASQNPSDHFLHGSSLSGLGKLSLTGILGVRWQRGSKCFHLKTSNIRFALEKAGADGAPKVTPRQTTPHNCSKLPPPNLKLHFASLSVTPERDESWCQGQEQKLSGLPIIFYMAPMKRRGFRPYHRSGEGGHIVTSLLSICSATSLPPRAFV